MYYLYILKNQKDNWYIGYTNDLKRRFKEHQKEDKYKLIYYEAYQLEKMARKREKQLKYYGSAWRALRKRISLEGGVLNSVIKNSSLRSNF